MRKALESINALAPSKEEKSIALICLVFIKEQSTGIIKGRGCANGHKQCQIIDKEQAASLEALILTGIIDALEKRCVASTETPSKFMQLFNVRFERSPEESLEQSNPCLRRMSKGNICCMLNWQKLCCAHYVPLYSSGIT
jgi:hypothetical protein